jgi:hypothetical protein
MKRYQKRQEFKNAKNIPNGILVGHEWERYAAAGMLEELPGLTREEQRAAEQAASEKARAANVARRLRTERAHATMYAPEEVRPGRGSGAFRASGEA